MRYDLRFLINWLHLIPDLIEQKYAREKKSNMNLSNIQYFYLIFFRFFLIVIARYRINTTKYLIKEPKMHRKVLPPLSLIHIWMFMRHYVSHVTCHVSPVTCHLSHVTCHLSHVKIIKKKKKLYKKNIPRKIRQIGGASWWRVCYQRGLPRLVLTFLLWHQLGLY